MTGFNGDNKFYLGSAPTISRESEKLAFNGGAWSISMFSSESIYDFYIMISGSDPIYGLFKCGSSQRLNTKFLSSSLHSAWI